MTASVPLYPSYPAQFFVRGGDAVKSLTAQDAAAAAMFASGRGAQLVPGYCPITLSAATIAASGTAYFKFRVQPRYQAFSRLWSILARSDAAGTGSTSQTYTVHTPISGTGVAHQAIVTPAVSFPVTQYEHLAAQSSSTTSLTMKIVNGSGNGLLVDAIGCMEVPRLNLALNATDGGVDTATLAHRQPIYDTAGKSLGGLADCVDTAFSAARRVGMFHHAWPIISGSETSKVKTVTNTTFGTNYVFETAAGATPRTPLFLGRKKFRDSVTGSSLISINIGVLAAVTGGTGEVKFTMTNGATTTLTISDTDTTFGGTGAGTWATGTIDIDTEDLAASNGLRDSTWDACEIQARKITSGTMYIAAISMWEGT